MGHNWDSMEEKQNTTVEVAREGVALYSAMQNGRGNTAIVGNNNTVNDSAVILRFLEIIADQNRVIAQLQNDLLKARWQLAQQLIHQ